MGYQNNSSLSASASNAYATTELKGIDVSEHNGVIDWNAVKNAGVEFAVIRMGYGSDLPQQDDKMFEWNVSECERKGIPWGAYLYSYALNVEDAKSEVAHALRLLQGKKPAFPIAFDMEDADGYKARHGMPSNDLLVQICDTFCSEVENNGFYVMVYANLDWLNNHLNDRRLDRYDKWVAQWAPACDYQGTHRLWQYTDSGYVNGISGKVDMNLAYSSFRAVLGPSTQNYTIRSGENLTVIAQRMNTTVNNILALNPQIKNKNLVFAGQVIQVPRN